MYLGIDFLFRPSGEPVLVEVNVGLPGGAEEYDRTVRARTGHASGVFDAIERLALAAYGRPFREYLNSLPFLPALKDLKLWMDGHGPVPDRLHPALRLEDKWVQYQILSDVVPMPRTMLLSPESLAEAREWLGKSGRLAAKRRTGRGGRGFVVIESAGQLGSLARAPEPYLLQEHIDSRAGRYHLSVRAVAFAGALVCAYANLAERDHSNHGIIVGVAEGKAFGLENAHFRTRRFDARSWEAEIWFEGPEPGHLRRNLYQDDAADTVLALPASVYRAVTAQAVRVERFYEALDPSALPPAWFETVR
jgi:hypothetical protein